MPWNDDTITPKILLEHMQAGFEALRTEMRQGDNGLRSEFRKEIEPLKKAVAQLQKNDEKTHLAIQRLYEKRVKTSAQVEDHEERITVIEDEEIPALKTAIGIA